MKEPVYVVSTEMIDEGKEHAKTEDPHEDVGKLEKDGDKAMNEENERKKPKSHQHQGSRARRNQGTRRLKKHKD
ncbi:hypothetical protein Tco_1087764 [Tanacetum coccineum]